MEDLTQIRDSSPELNMENPSVQQADSAPGQDDAGAGSASSWGEKSYARYKIYDRIKDHVSLRAVDAIIVISALLIIIFLVYGIMTGSPRA